MSTTGRKLRKIATGEKREEWVTDKGHKHAHVILLLCADIIFVSVNVNVHGCVFVREHVCNECVLSTLNYVYIKPI